MKRYPSGGRLRRHEYEVNWVPFVVAITMVLWIAIELAARVVAG